MVSSGPSTLLGTSGGNASVPGAIYIKLSQDALDLIRQGKGATRVQLILNSVSNSSGSAADSGPILKIGNTSFSASSIPEPSPLEVYAPADSPSESHLNTHDYAHIGTITGRMTVRAAGTGASASSRLKNQNSAFLKEKEANKATLLSSSVSSAGNSTKAPRRTTTGSSMRKSPPSGLGLVSSHAGPAGLLSPMAPKSLPVSPSQSEMTGSKGLATSNSSKKQNLASLSLVSGPMRVLHLLALGPTTPRTIASRTNMSQADVDGILAMYAKQDPANPSQVVLSDSTYKDLRIWDWSHYSNIDRKRVIADASAAYDRLRYAHDHPARLALDKPVVKAAPVKEPVPGSAAVAATAAAGRSIARPASANPSIGSSNPANAQTSRSGSVSPPMSASSVSASASAAGTGAGTGTLKRPRSTKLASGLASLPPKPGQHQHQHQQTLNSCAGNAAPSSTSSSGSTTTTTFTTNNTKTNPGNHPKSPLATVVTSSSATSPSKQNALSSSTSGAKRKAAVTAASVDPHAPMDGDRTNANANANSIVSAKVRKTDNAKDVKDSSVPPVSETEAEKEKENKSGSATTTKKPLQSTVSSSTKESASSSPSKYGVAKQTTPQKPKNSTSKSKLTDAELFELAQKFKDTYSEYEKLYKMVSKKQRKPKDQHQVQKLLTMHRDLASWKQKLWASSTNSHPSRTGEAA